MAAKVHSLLNSGDRYRVTADSGAIRDQDGLFVTRKISITARGTENNVISLFKPGQVYRDPTGGGGGQAQMFCQGPDAMTLVPYTGNDPHWDMDVSWIGIHSAYKTQATGFAYRVDDEWAQVETMFPKEVPVLGGGSPITAFATPPYVSKPPQNTSGSFKRARIIHFVPMKKVVGIMVSTGALGVSLADSRITALIASFTEPTGAGLLRNWTLGNAGSPALADPQWNWAAKFMESEADGGGAWVPRSLQVRRQLSAGPLYAFTMDVAYEQRVTPG